MIKILHIPTGGVQTDGISNCIITYLRAMSKKDMKVSLLACNQPSKQIQDLVKSANCEIIIIPGRKRNPLGYFTKILNLIRREQYDVVHVHGSSALMSIELLAAKKAGCPIRIAHSHNTACNHRFADRVLRPLFNRLYTHGMACGTAAGIWLFGHKPFYVLPNARDIDQYKYNSKSRGNRRRELGIPEEALVLGHVGAFNASKNHEFLMRIFYKVHQKKPNTFLLLTGDGPLKSKIEHLSVQYSLQDNVIFAGNTNAVENDLSAMDIFVFPSLYEGLPLCVIEAQASGLQCIISENITSDCVVTNLVRKLPLQAGANLWSHVILQTALLDRKLASDMANHELKQAGFDIKSGAIELRRLYELFVKEREAL